MSKIDTTYRNVKIGDFVEECCRWQEVLHIINIGALIHLYTESGGIIGYPNEELQVRRLDNEEDIEQEIRGAD